MVKCIISLINIRQQGGVFGLANTPEARGAYLKQAEFRNDRLVRPVVQQ